VLQVRLHNSLLLHHLVVVLSRLKRTSVDLLNRRCAILDEAGLKAIHLLKLLHLLHLLQLLQLLHLLELLQLLEFMELLKVLVG